MIFDASIVIYKNKIALARRDGDKLELSIPNENSVRVRDKDVELLVEGPQKGIPKAALGGDFDTAREMLSGQSATYKELADLVFGHDGAAERIAIYQEAYKGNQFRLDNGKIYSLTKQEVTEIEQKKVRKENEAKERAEFCSRAKKYQVIDSDHRFWGELESLALGKIEKSKTAVEIGIKESPEAAHEWLLKTNLWTSAINPYPSRAGEPSKAPSIILKGDDDIGRQDLCGLEAYAIDNAWSCDPDDAISWDNGSVWVHVADPASAVTPDSPADTEAANRSGTLYLPEGIVPMLPEEALPRFGLGLSDISRALSFHISLDSSATACNVEVIPSFIKVKRLSYENADPLLEEGSLKELAKIAEKRQEYRKNNGATEIDIPEVRVWVKEKHAFIDKIEHYKSSNVVREMMVLAGESFARWAFERNIPFPFYSQEAPGKMTDLPEGLAGEFAKRKLMKAGSASVQPHAHQGLGVTMYAQATSPLRRYGDLLGHQQARAFIRENGKKSSILQADELSMKLGKAAAGNMALRKAERESLSHWTIAYLLDHPDWEGEAISVYKVVNDTVFFIPDLGIETRIKAGDINLNEKVKIKLSKANLAKLDANFFIL